MNRYTVALAGNPNTGKSTLFNTLTGLRQHTGNWAGKTVDMAEGEFVRGESTFRMIDLPGTYSLYSNSADEEVARDYIIFEQPDVTVVVLDATSLERNLNLALQVMEMTNRVVVCINLIDEAKRLGIRIDIAQIGKRLGVPVVAISARNKIGIDDLLDRMEQVASGAIVPSPLQIQYNDAIERKLAELEPIVREQLGTRFPTRWIALRLLDGDESLLDSIKARINGTHEKRVAEEVVGYGRTACH
ncbi:MULTISPECIES: FeoB small GTPase domain-containing protein [unclassified Paenibacillus]|uniref:FeoB small GTPase domain-containing protein n=1 Tax=unclassified Paenibacillus TaxID=185978 RepID=UPI001C0F7C90|nr:MULTISPECIES: FeoB small GTPase domain-containing protein [unclassified Paenibacillus]MBU5441280.1 50S ribosome-binding GTPase [Paenibacillus sp. MSJ-34]CAH0122244.1 Fe(2+) transporter FeoB [Paenibacillus sp. CECT 9249]